MKTTDFQNGIFIVLCLTICNTALVTAYETKVRIGCDNRSLTLSCRKSSYPVINLKQARLQILATPSSIFCRSSSNTVSQNRTNCGKEDVLRFLQSKCNGMRISCKLLVKSKEIGNHCEGVLNFKVIYKCMAAKTATKTANARTTAQDTQPTRQATIKTVEKDYKTTTLLPSLSVEVANHERTSPGDIFAAKITPRFETSKILQLHTATKHKFPTLDPVSTTSTRLKMKTCTTKPVSTSSEILQNSQPKASKILTTPKVKEGERRNACSRLSVPAFLGKLAFVCIWFTTMLFYV